MESKIRRMETVDEKVAEILRSKTPTERLAMANAMWKFAWQMTRGSQSGRIPIGRLTKSIATSRRGCRMEPSDLLRRFVIANRSSERFKNIPRSTSFTTVQG